jgi:methylenetetrahydrofolate reductase (NADPH)
MHIIDRFKTGKPVFSYEVFPPKRDGDLESLFKAVDELKVLSPDFVSVTYGAGGSTRDLTCDIAARLRAAGVLPLVHFTCVGQTREEIRCRLEKMREAGTENILALRGDPPKGETAFTPPNGGFRYASEMVRFIRSEGFRFCLGVAGYPEGHPESSGREADWDRLKNKLDAGGDFVVTQLFFDNQDYFRFVERLRARGCDAPVHPGIWLLTDAAQLDRLGGLSGARIPADLRKAVEAVREDKEAVRKLGVDYAVAQCSDLLQNGAPGIHFYSMNRSRSAVEVFQTLRAKGLAP